MSSVLSQTSEDFEFLVIDGASTDGSIDIIHGFEGMDTRHPFLWISEPDSGRYSAMNHGLALAHGDYVLFLNSGDQFYDKDVINDFVSFNGSADIISGIEFIPELDKVCNPPDPESLTYDYLVDDVLRHQSTFIRRSLLQEMGGYSEKYKIVSDWEFWLKALVKENASYMVFPRVVSVFEWGGVSNQNEFLHKKQEEEQDVLSTILPRVHQNIVELRALRRIKQEFDFLKNGDVGWLVRGMLHLKRLKHRT